ncbi:MAG: GGDEF domain-containing protein [Rhizobium sp.]|nr:GGDEF domain-containing protein [Rhizobium sp.]
MVPRLQKWILKSIDAGAFSTHADVMHFAWTRSLWTTVAAVVLNFVVYQLFGRLGLFAVTLPPDPWADSVVTMFVAGPICFLAYYTVGRAVMDLAISRDAFERLSRTDPLTGLLNRRAFVDTIASMRTPYVIAAIDIDRFKSINDTHGHSAGDAVLIEVADQLRRTLGDGAVLARLGGEEFGVAMQDPGRETAIALLDRARNLLETQVFRVGGKEVSVTFSAGLSKSGGEHGYSMLLTDADKALYLAKAAGRNRVVHADELAALTPLADYLPQQATG